ESLHVFPKVSVGDGTKPQSSIFKFLPFSTSSSPFGIPLPLGDKVDCPSTPLFELTYERNPLGSSADHSLVVNTQSLDVVYNPSTIRTVKRFLTLWNYEGSPRSGEALNLSAAARSRYEMFKKHTKDELRHRWDLMLEGKESSLQIARWDVQMDICAPQIIVPESFSEGSSTVVLIDLGHVQFSNSAMLHKTPPDKMEDISDDEDFKTPCSSPPELVQLEETSPKKPDSSFLRKECSVINDNFVISSGQGSAFTESDILDRMYKRYSLNLQDMQVLVGTSKESWKFAQSKGTSRMHVLDRFSICIQVERRLLATDDPHWPSVILSMKLPRLTAHVNEQKVHAVQMCLSRLKESTSARPKSWSSQGVGTPLLSLDDTAKNDPSGTGGG
ncbi:vacuolar protein sorting-associated protein 13D isoform X3, partial [Ixodes scapularis]